MNILEVSKFLSFFLLNIFEIFYLDSNSTLGYIFLEVSLLYSF